MHRLIDQSVAKRVEMISCARGFQRSACARSKGASVPECCARGAAGRISLLQRRGESILLDTKNKKRMRTVAMRCVTSENARRECEMGMR